MFSRHVLFGPSHECRVVVAVAVVSRFLFRFFVFFALFIDLLTDKVQPPSRLFIFVWWRHPATDWGDISQG